MRYTEKINRKFFISGLAAAILLSAAAFPQSAGAWRSTGWSGSVYHYDSWDARQMQRSAQSDAAEQRRETARAQRRDEIAEQREAGQAQFLASQAEIRASSQAASTAPRDYFYRKPGTTMSTLPAASVEIKAGDQTYHYFSGIFFRQLPAGYIVVPAPLGAVVNKLPEGVRAAAYQGDVDTYFHYFGTFFTAEGDKFKVVQPPAGTIVGYVPDGYTETEVDGSPRLHFGPHQFKPVFLQNLLVYQVVQG